MKWYQLVLIQLLGLSIYTIWQEQLDFKTMTMYKIGKALDIIFMNYHRTNIKLINMAHGNGKQRN